MIGVSIADEFFIGQYDSLYDEQLNEQYDSVTTSSHSNVTISILISS